MQSIAFTQEQKDILVVKIKAYLAKELDLEVGQFDAEFLLEFFSKEIVPFTLSKPQFNEMSLP